MGDELRDELARAITACIRGRRWRDVTPLDAAEAVLPIVERRIAQARAEAWSEGYQEDGYVRNPYRQHSEEVTSDGE